LPGPTLCQGPRGLTRPGDEADAIGDFGPWTDRSVTVSGGNPRVISTGDAAVIVQHESQQATVLPPEALTPPAQVDAPPGLANLPDTAGMFVGRAADLARLERALSGGGTWWCRR